MAAPASAAPQVTPGQWEATMTVIDASMPGMPPDAMAMLKGRPTTTRYCLTPQEAEARPEKLLNADKSCQIKRFNLAAGSIDAEMTCKGEMGPTTIRMQGRYTATSYEMTSNMSSGPMTMKSRMVARRLGPCS